jgi:adenosylhomocysteine nucleosidase
MSFAKIGIIGAMAEEVELLHKHTEVRSSVTKAGITYFEGDFQGKHIVFCKSGVGKVNAAVCTQILIDQGVDCVLFTGVAGALDPTLEVGDIVISTSAMQHDMDVTPLGFPRGVIPFQDTPSEFVADPTLVDWAVAAAAKHFEGRYQTGKILSGDQFVASRETVRFLHEEMGGSCTEMEGAALAQVCAMNEVPFVVIRSMSDKADGSAHISFAEFTVTAADHSYLIIQDMIAKM